MKTNALFDFHRNLFIWWSYFFSTMEEIIFSYKIIFKEQFSFRIMSPLDFTSVLKDWLLLLWLYCLFLWFNKTGITKRFVFKTCSLHQLRPITFARMNVSNMWNILYKSDLCRNVKLHWFSASLLLCRRMRLKVKAF